MMQYLPSIGSATSVAPTHTWELLKQPCCHLQLDFADPFMGSMFLVLVDACTN